MCSATTAPASRPSSRSWPGCTSTTRARSGSTAKTVKFGSPRDALDAGIATVYQDLAMVPLMSVWRNFFLGAEPTKGIGPLRWIDKAKAKRIAKEEMAKMGIDIRDTEQPVGTLSGGERQSVAIARAGVLRCQGADPRRADVGARRQAVGCRAQVHRRGPQPRAGRDLHHPQPAPCLPGRRPVHDPQPRPVDGSTSPRKRSASTS